jgi:dienelactone hydrolase
MQSRKIEYTDGRIGFIGQLYWDDSHDRSRPGVIVFPEAFGLGDHARQCAERLAHRGYMALAADVIGGGQLFADIQSVAPTMQALYGDRANWRGRARAALDVLAAQPQVDATKIAAIGFCFGGATALELARSGAPLAAVVTFHAGLLPELPGDAGRVGARVLICHGADDPLVKREALDAVMDEFRRDRVDWQLIHYGNAVHSFTEPAAAQRNMPGLAYDARADRRSWAAMCALFDEIFV